jgi:YVTN family beta-propeller protein
VVANSIDVVKDGGALKSVPDNKLFVIDLTTSPPAVIATVQTGKQPSGMAINRAGNLALVANRADNSVSVLSISGKTVAVIGTVALAPAEPATIRRGHHARRQARAGGQGDGEQGRPARYRWYYGDLQRL